MRSAVKKTLKGGSFGSLLFCLLIPAILSFGAVPSDQSGNFRLLYFFSPTCPHCTEAKPYITDLAKKYSVEGFIYHSTGKAADLPFPVRPGDKAIASKYGVKGVPTLVVLDNGRVKQKFSGSKTIKDAGFIMNAFVKGALSVSEASAAAPQKEFMVTGWVIHRGSYFGPDSKFFLSDRQKELPVAPWLPLETAKSPFKKKRPKLMSDLIGKPVVLKGSLQKKNSGLVFSVKEDFS